MTRSPGMDSESFYFVGLIDAILWIAFILFFRTRMRKSGGFSIDLFYSIKLIFVPIILMMPFAYSEANIIATGDSFYTYIDFIPRAAVLVAIAIFITYLGSHLGRKSTHPLLLQRFVIQSIKSFWVTRFGMMTILSACIFATATVIGLGFEIGDARTSAFESKSFRFVFNIYAFCVGWGLVLSLIRLHLSGYKSRLALLSSALLIGMSFISGTRSTSILNIVNFVAIVSVATKTKNIVRLAFFSIFVLLGLVYVLGFREGVFDLSIVSQAPDKLLYGNTFSDFRDFVWMTSGWDRNLLLGQTYMSGFLSFIPASALPVRTEWSWAAFSLVSSGLGIEGIDYFPGLRAVIFGEPYFNFGLVGLGISAFMLGFVLGRISKQIDQVRSDDPKLRLVSVASSFFYMDFIVLQFFNTSGFFTLYLATFFLLLGLVFKPYFKKPAP